MESFNITIPFCLVIIVLTVVFIIITVQASEEKLLKKRRMVESFPSIISTLGVIGTFLGITIGLSDFDTNNIDKSIPTLLEGLKTAFWTSLCGMAGSMFLRSFFTDRKYDNQEGGMSDMQVAQAAICKAVDNMSKSVVAASQSTEQALKTFTSAQSAYGNQMLEATKNIKDNVASLKVASESTTNKVADIEGAMQSLMLVAGDSQEKLSKTVTSLETISATATKTENKISEMVDISSGMSSAQDDLLAETKKFSEVLRGEVDSIEVKMQETNALLTAKFDEFSELLKKSNTEALVEVMKKVTEEFQKQMNALINKLIQENFDQLNKSVEKLNQWQQENKAMIQELTSKYHQMAEDFNGTSTTLKTVSEDAHRLTADGGKLQQLVSILAEVMVNDKKFVEITSNLTKTTELTKDSMQSFSSSTNNLKQWIDKQKGLADSVKVLVAKLDELNNIRDYGEQFWQSTRQSMNEGVAIIKQGSQELNAQLTNLDRQFYGRLSATLSELDKCVAAMVNEINKRR